MKNSKERNEIKENEPPRKAIPFLTEALTLAALTALSYLYAFVFELGFLSHFGIGATLVNVKIDAVFLAGFLVAVLSLMVYMCLELVLFVNFFKIRRRLVVFEVYTGMMFGMLALLTLVSVRVGLKMFVVWAVLTALFVLIFTVNMAADEANEDKKIDNEKNDPLLGRIQESFAATITNTIGPELVLVLIMLIGVAPLLVGVSGVSLAFTKTKWEVLVQSEKWVFVRPFSGLAILAEYDPKNNHLTGNVRFVPLGSEGAKEFKIKEIGALRKAE